MLANERTLLAWVRTVLAVVRSTFAFYALEGTPGLGESSLSGATYLMAASAIVSFGTGAVRYASVADLLREKAARHRHREGIGVDNKSDTPRIFLLGDPTSDVPRADDAILADRIYGHDHAIGGHIRGCVVQVVREV